MEAEEQHFMQVQTKDAPIVLATSAYCWFGCGKHLDREDPDNYRQVVSWVHGPKLDGPVLREQTGNMAHSECVQDAINGLAPDQEKLF